MNDFPRKKYKTIYADPPWPEHGGGKVQRGADRHYELMTVAEIAALPVGDLADDEGCHLWLWVTGNYLMKSREVIDAWGFRYVNYVPWFKDKIGIGQYFRGASELCLFCVRGKLPFKIGPEGQRKATPQCLFAPEDDPTSNHLPLNGEVGPEYQSQCLFAPRGKHSRKPPQMRQVIETVSYAPRIELFARYEMEGWDVWGNEVPIDNPLMLL